MLKYTIYLYLKSGLSKRVELFAYTMQEARQEAQNKYKGSSVSMSWYNFPLEYSH